MKNRASPMIFLLPVSNKSYSRHELKVQLPVIIKNSSFCPADRMPTLERWCHRCSDTGRSHAWACLSCPPPAKGMALKVLSSVALWKLPSAKGSCLKAMPPPQGQPPSNDSLGEYRVTSPKEGQWQRGHLAREHPMGKP